MDKDEATAKIEELFYGLAVGTTDLQTVMQGVLIYRPTLSLEEFAGLHAHYMQEYQE